jgi:hypothetical protein
LIDLPKTETCAAATEKGEGTALGGVKTGAKAQKQVEQPRSVAKPIDIK